MTSKQELLQWMDNTITTLESNISNDQPLTRDESKGLLGVQYDPKTDKYATKYTDPTGNVHEFKWFSSARAAAICFDALSLLVSSYAKIPHPQLNYPPPGYTQQQSTNNTSNRNKNDNNNSLNVGLKRLKSIRTARSLIRQKTTEKFNILKGLIANAKHNLDSNKYSNLENDLNKINDLIIDNKWRERNYKMPKFYVKHMANIHFKLVSLDESNIQKKLLKIFDEKLNFNQIKLFTRTKSFWDGEFSDLDESNSDKKQEIIDNDDDCGKCDCGGFLLETKARICTYCGNDITRLYITLFGCTRCGFEEENALCLNCQTAKNLEQLDDGDISEDDDFNNPINKGINNISDMGGDMSILERLEKLDQVRDNKNEMIGMIGIQRLKSYEYVFPDRQNTIDMPEYKQAMQLLINPLYGNSTQTKGKNDSNYNKNVVTKGGDIDEKNDFDMGGFGYNDGIGGGGMMGFGGVSDGFGISGGGVIGARQTISPAMMIGRKLEGLKERIEEYKQEKLGGNIIFEIKGYNDFKNKDKKIQGEMVNVVEMLKEMKQLSETYFKDYVFRNEWSHHLLDVFSKVEFGNEQWDAFNFGILRQKSEQIGTSVDGNTPTIRNVMRSFNEYKDTISPMGNVKNNESNQ